MSEDIPLKFWREYESLDMIERKKKIKPIVGTFNKLFSLKDEKLRKHAITIGLMGYFDDLIEYMDSKKRER